MVHVGGVENREWHGLETARNGGSLGAVDAPGERGRAMIRVGSLQRWGFALIGGGTAAFVLVAAVANVAMANWRDAGFLLAFAGWLIYLTALRWSRFVEPTAEGVRYNNWGVVRVLPWARIRGFRVRRTLVGRGPGSWMVVAERGAARSVTLRATNQPGSRRQRPSVGEQAARELAREFDDLRQRES